MMQKKLLVPKAVSYNPYAKSNHINYHGTKAFVPAGTRLPRGLSREEKFNGLRGLARQSSHYIKPLSNRNKRIRALLEKYGVKTEKIIEDLKDGTALFEHEGFELASEEGKTLFAERPGFFLKKLEEIAAKLTILEVGHGHLHAGNFAITRKGEVLLLDLGRATVANDGEESVGPTKARKKKIITNLNYFCDKISVFYFRTVKKRNPSPVEWLKLKKKIWGRTIAIGKNFGDQLEKELAKK